MNTNEHSRYIGQFIKSSLTSALSLLLWMLALISPQWPLHGACSRELGGLIYNDVWGQTPDDRVICITNNASLSNVAVLPGTTILIQSNVTITVLGVFSAIGTESDPILFRPTPDNHHGWEGFYFENTVPGSEFEWCQIEGTVSTALELVRSTPLIRNSIFTNNVVSGNGAAIMADIPGRHLMISNCTFAANRATQDGPAIWANVSTGRLDVVKCEFVNNKANYGYATRHTYGGAVRVQGNARFSQCLFQGNRAHAYTIYARNGVYVRGGGLWIGGGDFEITACTFIDCAAQMTAHFQTPDWSYPQGGAIYFDLGTLRVMNTLVAENWLSAQRNRAYRGSGLFVRQGTAEVINCTLVENQGHAAIHNDGGTLTVLNSILYFNYDDVTQISGMAESVTYCDVQGGYTGTGNIDFNPILDSDYRIIPGSPTIDAGDPEGANQDVYFPPSLGTSRTDLGIMGGEAAALWLETQYEGPQEVFRVELDRLVTWLDQPGVILQNAVSIQGPWYDYDGPSFLLNERRAVRLQPTDPRQFFRLIRP